MEGRYSVVDIETTGLRSCDRVIEIAILTLDDTGNIGSAFTSVIDPERDPGPRHLHGVSRAQCRDAPTFPELARTVHECLVGTRLVAHNFRFDWAFLRREFRRCGVSFLREPTGMCTRRSSRALGIRSSLAAACAAMGVPPPVPHHALDDAVATYRLWCALREQGVFPDEPEALRAGAGWRGLPTSVAPRPREASPPQAPTWGPDR